MGTGPQIQQTGEAGNRTNSPSGLQGERFNHYTTVVSSLLYNTIKLDWGIPIVLEP